MTRWCFVLWLLPFGSIVLGCRGSDERLSPSPVAPPTHVTPTATGAPTVLLQPSGGEPAQVQVELARTPAEREKGLMYRRSMADDQGMLFVFTEETVQSFWMKNTYLPLDMLFITSDMIVVGIVENAEPLTLSPRTVNLPSLFVLEVNAGWTRKHGITPGAQVSFRNVPLDAQ